jgi:hypothetical protein
MCLPQPRCLGTVGVPKSDETAVVDREEGNNLVRQADTDCVGLTSSELDVTAADLAGRAATGPLHEQNRQPGTTRKSSLNGPQVDVHSASECVFRPS